MEPELAAALLMERLVKETYSQRGPNSVPPLQWSILRFLKDAPDEKCRIKFISVYLGITHAPVSRAVGTLVQRGLVDRVNGLPDRQSPLQITKSGIDTLKADPILKLAARVKSLSEHELKAFSRSISLISLNLGNE